MLLASDWASAGNAGLRLAVLPGPTLVALKLAAVDELLPIYPGAVGIKGRSAMNKKQLVNALRNH